MNSVTISEQEGILEGGGTVFVFDGLRIAHNIGELCADMWNKNTVLLPMHIPLSTGPEKNILCKYINADMQIHKYIYFLVSTMPALRKNGAKTAPLRVPFGCP